MDRGTWQKEPGTCRCWSPQPDRCWSHRSSTQADLWENKKRSDEIITRMGFGTTRKHLVWFELGEGAYLQCFSVQNQASWSCTGAPLLFHQSKCTWPGLYPPAGGPCTAVSQLYSGWHWQMWPSLISYYNTPEEERRGRKKKKMSTDAKVDGYE